MTSRESEISQIEREIFDVRVQKLKLRLGWPDLQKRSGAVHIHHAPKHPWEENRMLWDAYYEPHERRRRGEI